MAYLTSCPLCGREKVSSECISCPECGHNVAVDLQKQGEEILHQELEREREKLENKIVGKWCSEWETSEWKTSSGFKKSYKYRFVYKFGKKEFSSQQEVIGEMPYYKDKDSYNEAGRYSITGEILKKENDKFERKISIIGNELKIENSGTYFRES
ncbi:MAG: hypothetical protein LBD23_12385 [Oscillospiraceae bacterium]|nr:hypothetical protein [Oscillospiraceae bacterium]